MVEVGKMNRLPVVRAVDFGLFLDGGTLGEILLPKRYTTETLKPGDTVEVFIMLDSEDRLTAVTTKPYAMVDEFASLRVASVTPVGAFLDWGLPKDLLVPFREQRIKMREGEWYVVRVYFDRTSGRLAASAKLDKFLDLTPPRYEVGETVDLLLCSRTDLGYKAIVNGTHWGLLFHNEVFTPLQRGQRMAGFIKEVRPDGKIDLCLQPPGQEKVGGLADEIMDTLRGQGGFLPLDASSPAEAVYARFGVSRKNFKKALGALYKNRLVRFADGGTRLVDEG